MGRWNRRCRHRLPHHFGWRADYPLQFHRATMAPDLSPADTSHAMGISTVRPRRRCSQQLLRPGGCGTVFKITPSGCTYDSLPTSTAPTALSLSPACCRHGWEPLRNNLEWRSHAARDSIQNHHRRNADHVAQLHSLRRGGSSDGALLQAPDGSLYGTTGQGRNRLRRHGVQAGISPAVRSRDSLPAR